MNKLKEIYSILYKTFGPQGWWPVINNKTLLCEYGLNAPRNDSERFEICIGAVLAQGTNWYPNVVRALQQLKLGRQLTKNELEVIKKAEILKGKILERPKKITKEDMFTQNTSWKNAEKAIFNLNKDNILEINKIKSINQKKLANLIKPSGYYNQKAERLKIAAEFFSKNKSQTRQQLLEVKGIGPETADSILLYAFNQPIFVVDAYTKRIFSRIGICKDECKYDGLQNIFHENLPKDHKLFNEYHALLVALGKKYCTKQPNCKECPIAKLCSKKFI